MRIPQQVSERVKEAPAQALRAVFSGIGQVLLMADRIRSNRSADPARAHPAATESPGQAAPGAPKEETRWRSLDETGNVRLLSEEDATGRAAPAADSPAAPAPGDIQPAATAKPPAPVPGPSAARKPAARKPSAARKPAASRPATTSKPATRQGTAPGPEQADLPVPNYDDLSVSSLRARLRNLDAAQVEALLGYEKAHAGRAEVLTMYERRIAKLRNGRA